MNQSSQEKYHQCLREERNAWTNHLPPASVCLWIPLDNKYLSILKHTVWAESSQSLLGFLRAKSGPSQCVPTPHLFSRLYPFLRLQALLLLSVFSDSLTPLVKLSSTIGFHTSRPLFKPITLLASNLPFVDSYRTHFQTMQWTFGAQWSCL